MSNAVRDDSKKYTVDDVVNMDKHAELIEGNLVITDVSTITHQRVISIIRRAFEQHIESRHGECEVFTDNAGLFCNELCESKNNFFIPDVMVVCDKSGIKDDGIHVAPRFIAEVTSVSTRKHDYSSKLAVYAQIGVEEYWVVDLQKKIVARHMLDNDYMPELYCSPSLSAIPVYTYPDLEIDLSRIFE